MEIRENRAVTCLLSQSIQQLQLRTARSGGLCWTDEADVLRDGEILSVRAGVALRCRWAAAEILVFWFRNFLTIPYQVILCANRER